MYNVEIRLYNLDKENKNDLEKKIKDLLDLPNTHGTYELNKEED